MLEKNHIYSIIRKAFPGSKIRSFHRSPVAQVNWVYKVQLNDPDRAVIVRVSPEHHPWKTEKEKKIYKLLSKVDVPVPDFLHVDSSKKIIPHNYQIMECLPGERLRTVIEKFPHEKDKLYFELGKTLGKIHSVKLDKFGWIHSEQEHMPAKSDSWKEVFMLMCIDELLEISQPKFLELAPYIKDYIDFNQHLLDIDVAPQLLHNDFFIDNILMHNSGNKWEISGIIDFEWAFAGHNEFEIAKVISQMLLDYPSHEYKPEAKGFFRGYRKYSRISRDFEKRRPLYTLHHLLHWANHCTRNRQRCLEAGIKVDEVMGYFYSDIRDILK